METSVSNNNIAESDPRIEGLEKYIIAFWDFVGDSDLRSNDRFEVHLGGSVHTNILCSTSKKEEIEEVWML